MQAHFAIALLCAAATGTLARGQTTLSTYGGSVGDEFGAVVLPTADQNNDGYVDVLIGAPGNNSDRGMIRCLSGRFLATGAGPSVLWDLFPAVNAGARFGSSICEVASLTGNSATDFVVGAPGFVAGGVNVGAVFLIDGRKREPRPYTPDRSILNMPRP